MMHIKRLAPLIALLLIFLAACAVQPDSETNSHINTEATPDIAQQGEESGHAGDLPPDDMLLLPAPTQTPTPTAPPTPTPVVVRDMDEKKAYLLENGVNLRAGPGTDFDSLSMLSQHDAFLVNGEAEDWYRVKHQDMEGFIAAQFVAFGTPPKPTPTPKPKPTPKPFTVERISSMSGYISAGSVNIRKGADQSYDILYEGKRYEKLVITGKSADWYRVRYNGRTGFLKMRYARIGVSPGKYEPVGKYKREDVLLLSQIAYREGGRGDVEGYKAVASVVLNRVKSKKYPNSIEKVVFQGNGAQFSPAENENSLRLTVPSDACVEAVRDVLKNGSILPSNVLYFRTASRGTEWASSRTYYATYGGNCFFV